MTGHGFRGLASTILHEQGYNHEHIELQLAHAPRNAVSAAYNHALYLEPRAKMMQDWAPRSLRPLLEYLLNGFFYQLLVLVAVVAQRVLTDSSPDQGLGLRVVQVDNHRSYDILLRSDSAHPSADSAHTPRAIGGLLFHASVCGQDQVRVLSF